VSKRKRQRRSRSQQILWLLSLVIVGSMVISLVIVALPSGPAPTPLHQLPHPSQQSLRARPPKNHRQLWRRLSRL
jgi:hypothetical protein